MTLACAFPAVAMPIVGAPGPVGALTVSKKVSVVNRAPSKTSSVIVAVPLWAAAGVTVTVRAVPLPPKTMFASGTSAVFDERPSMMRLAAGDSPPSSTVTASAPVLPFTKMV